MYKLIGKLEHIIHSNFSHDFNKIENVIKSNDVFIELDTLEQELIIEEAMEKHSEISEKKKITVETKISQNDTNKQTTIPKYRFGLQNIEEEKIKLDDGRELTEGEIMSDRVKAVMINPPTPENWERRAKIFEDAAILSASLPPQKSEGWFKMRENKVTGSTAGTVLNMNKHQAQYTFILDKVLGAEFKGNFATYHGNIFEDAVRLMYEYNNDVHTEEFGLMPHYDKDMKILAASPDGIVSPYCRDMKTPTPLVGRMLEIKCPSMRKIQYSGDIKDTICPVYYWCQIQQQLECLNLDECDFIQCNIERYGGREEWLADTHPECDYRSAKYGNLRGIVIELVEQNLTTEDFNSYGFYNDMTIWTKTKPVYPPKLDMSLKELDEWVLNELGNIEKNNKKNYFEWKEKMNLEYQKPEEDRNITPRPKNMVLYGITYWRLIEQNCTLILRDREWFKSQLPIYEKIWSYVEYLRANLDVCEKWKEWIVSQPRKYNDKIMAKLDMLIQEKKNQTNDINVEPNKPNEANEPNETNEPIEIIQESKKSKSSKSSKSRKKQDGVPDDKLNTEQGITINLDSDDETQSKNIVKTKKSKKNEKDELEQNELEQNELEQVEVDTQIEVMEQIEETGEIEQVDIIEKVKRKYVRKPKQN